MVMFILGIATNGSKGVRHRVSHHTTFAGKDSKFTPNKCHNACPKALRALACLRCVTRAAQQITDVAEVECGFFLFG